MRLIGITGGIGTGKSVVSRICRLKGYAVYDCDLEAKRLMDSSEWLKRELSAIAGEKVISSEGNINRKELSQILFTDHGIRRKVNSLVHRMVREDIEIWARHESIDDGVGHPEYRFVESAILSSSGLSEICERIWLVECDENLRIERAIKRGNIDLDNLLLRIESQREEFKTLPAYKTDRINNDGDRSLLEQIDTLLRELKTM